MSDWSTVTRRDALRISLAAASLLVIGGCRSTGSTKQLDKANKDLGKALDQVADNDVQQKELASIARRIHVKVREMIEDHREFRTDFDTLSAKRGVKSEELLRIGREFQKRRVAWRDAVLRLQDELRAAVTAEEWNEVVAVLNRKAEAVGVSGVSSKG